MDEDRVDDVDDRGELHPDTRRAVQAAAERLNYVPNSVARALASGKTGTLGVIITDSASPIYASVLSEGATAILSNRPTRLQIRIQTEHLSPVAVPVSWATVNRQLHSELGNTSLGHHDTSHNT